MYLACDLLDVQDKSVWKFYLTPCFQNCLPGDRGSVVLLVANRIN